MREIWKIGALLTVVAAAALTAVAVFTGSGYASASAPRQSLAVPVNVTAPTITGTFREGSTVTATNGTWTQNPTLYTYEWQRCNAQGTGCVVFLATAKNTYLLTKVDVGHTLLLLVTASNASGKSAPANSQKSPVIAANVVPTNITAPTITGTFREGSTVTATNGTWTQNPTGFTYEWQRCDAQGSGCARFLVTAKNTYLLTKADVGHTLLLLVTASNASGKSVPANSQKSPVIAANVAPTGVTRPTIQGVATVGETLTAAPGTFTGAPDRFSFRWQRCDPSGANCVIIAGAAGRTYGVRRADIDHTLRVQVTARNATGASTPVVSEPTKLVTAATGTGGTGITGAVSIANVSLPNRLVIAGVRFTPNPVRSRSEPIEARFRVTDLRGRPVAGALVYVIGLPYGRILNAPEQTTGPSGYATIPLQPTTQLPLINGGALVMFVRARKPGENLLAGVSTRRLVQLRVAAP